VNLTWDEIDALGYAGTSSWDVALYCEHMLERLRDARDERREPGRWPQTKAERLAWANLRQRAWRAANLERKRELDREAARRYRARQRAERQAA
jgi:hypothetical protein